MDLSLVPIDDLIAEIDKRVESCAILTHKVSMGKDAYDWHVFGNRITVIGLLNIAIDHIKDDFNVSETGKFTED